MGAVEDRVKDLIAKKTNVESTRLTPSTYFGDLGLDSLEITELSLDIQDEFGISIPEDDLNNIKTVGDAINYVLGRGDRIK